MAEAAKNRVVALHAPRRAFARGALAGLAKLGYEMAPPGKRSDETRDVVLAAGRELSRLPAGVHEPVILLERRGRERGPRDARVVATLSRPATLVELYRALQFALEDNPRRVPRVALTLPARCASGDRDWPGAIVSLSEGGCLVRTAHPLASRRRFQLWFPLPDTGLVEVTARPLYDGRGLLGLEFLDLDDKTRRAIASCVEHALGDT